LLSEIRVCTPAVVKVYCALAEVSNALFQKRTEQQMSSRKALRKQHDELSWNTYYATKPAATEPTVVATIVEV